MGTIAASARPLNLTDAQSHPAFAYLPETGEEAYNSFLGVPVLRAGRTLGVLVVQNRTKRAYREDEVEALARQPPWFSPKSSQPGMVFVWRVQESNWISGGR